MNNIYRYIAAGLAASLFTATVGAQTVNNSPAAKEKLVSDALWLNTDNAAGAAVDGHRKYADVVFGYDFYGGDFNRPQQGDSGNSFSFKSEGGGFVTPGFYAWGKFTYNRDKVKNTLYNSGILDPFRGMPYFAADTNRSDWNNQYYDLEYRIASKKFWDKLAVGVSGEYVSSLGAKQVDMRVESRYYTFVIRPGIVYSPGKRHNIGICAEYYNLREVSSMLNANSYVDQTVWWMVGLGDGTYEASRGGTRHYNGNSVGGGLQYNYDGGVRLMLDAKYTQKVEDVNYGTGRRQNYGSVKDNALNVKLTAVFNPAGEYSYRLKASLLDRDIDGIEYIQTYESTGDWADYVTQWHGVRSTYSTLNVKGSYEVIRNAGDEYRWSAGIWADYTDYEEKYLIPASHRTAENVKAGLNLKYNAPLGRRLDNRLLVGAGYAYNANLGGEYVYGGNHPEYPTVEKFMPWDTDYLTTDYHDMNVSVCYSQRLRAKARANFFVGAEFRYLKTSAERFNHRSIAGFTAGCNF